MKENEKIKEAVEELEEISDDYTIRRIAELREKGRRDYNAAIQYATEKGLTEGRAKGHLEGQSDERRKIAKKMLKLGKTMEEIIEITELSKEEIENL